MPERRAAFGRRAAELIDARRDAVADRLDDIAHVVHRRADAVEVAGSKVSRAAHGTADTIDTAARYVREHHSTSQMVSGLGNVVRAHPIKAMLAVLAVGYLAGRNRHARL